LEDTCQRCHEPLRGNDRYCPACGLPQLTYLAAEMPQVAADEAGSRGNGLGAYAGQSAFGATDGIEWKPALNAALTLGVPTGILCFGVLPIGLLGMMAASAWAVSLYAKRTRPVDLTAGTGARIGLVTGLFASWLTVSLFGSGFWVSRFVLHQGGEWDSLWLSQVEKSNQEMLAQIGAGSAQSAQVAATLRTLMLSAEGRAGLPLSGLMLVAAILVVLAVAGGALGAKLVVAPRRPGA
jgi:hypothetical protein